MSAEDDVARIAALEEILEEFDLDAIRVRLGESEYDLVRREPTVFAAGPAPASAPVASAADGTPTLPGATAPANVKRVTAPVVGVFYRSGSPGADAFVEVGDRVAPGQVLCILEAMKLMNEITSEYAGTVARIVPENAELVSLGDDLFWIEP